MSHTGLFSGLYSRVREYAELLDDVIIQLKSGRSTPSDPARQRLAKLLLALGKSSPADLSTQLLAALVKEQDGDRPGRWSEVGEALLGHEVTPRIIECLEALALTIEHERAGMLSKMRGRGC